MSAARLPFCIPVGWADADTFENWLAYPRLSPDGYHVVNVTRGSKGDLSHDYTATVDDFGNLVRVGNCWPKWINSIGQMGQGATR